MGLKKLPKQDRSRLLVKSILDAGIKLIQDDKTFTTNSIAQEAGVSIGSLYQYFDTKEDILEEIILYFFKEQNDQIFDLIKKVDFKTKEQYLEEVVKSTYTVLFQHKNITSKLTVLAQVNNLMKIVDSIDKETISMLHEKFRLYFKDLKEDELISIIYAIKGMNLKSASSLNEEKILENAISITRSTLLK